MTPGGFGAPRRPRLRPRTVEPPLPDVHPDEAFEQRQDFLEAAYEAERRLDRRDDYAGRAWPSARLVALPTAEPVERKAAA